MHDQKKYHEAEEFYRRASEITEKQRGPNHPNVAAGLTKQARNSDAEGKHSEAEALNLLGVIYSSQGNYKAAESRYQEALKLREKL